MFDIRIKMKICLLLVAALSGCLALKRVPLYKMKTARATLEVLFPKPSTFN